MRHLIIAIAILAITLNLSTFAKTSDKSWEASVTLNNRSKTCLSTGEFECTVTVESRKQKLGEVMTNEIAEGILGISLPEGAQAIVIGKEEGWNASEGDTSEYDEIINPQINMVISGEVPGFIRIPKQAMIYSVFWEGFVGYYLEN